jgi:hypothetical protein
MIEGPQGESFILWGYAIIFAMLKIECVNHSYRNASTGFLVAARQLCQLTVSKAIANAIIPANPNIHQLSSVYKQRSVAIYAWHTKQLVLQ